MAVLADHECEAPWIVDVVQSLRDRTLVRAYRPSEFEGDLRLGLLESIREFAGEKLIGRPIRSQAIDRHAEYYIRICKEWSMYSRRKNISEDPARLSIELENLVAIQRRSRREAYSSEGSLCRAIQVVVPIFHVLSPRGVFRICCDWFSSSLSVDWPDSLDRPSLFEACITLGIVAIRNHSPRLATSILERAVVLAEEDSHHIYLPEILQLLGRLYSIQGELQKARRFIERAMKLANKHGDPRLLFETTKALGFVTFYERNFEESTVIFERCAAIAAKRGDTEEVIINSYNTADSCLYFGDYDRAYTFSEKAIRESLGANGLLYIRHKAEGLNAYVRGVRDLDPSSIEDLRSWVEFADRNGYADQRVESRQRLAEVFEKFGNKEEAIRIARESLKLARELEDVFSEEEVLSLLENWKQEDNT